MINPIQEKGEIALLCNNNKVIDLDSLEQWQNDQLTGFLDNDTLSQANSSLQFIDKIIWDWLKSLTKEDWKQIRRHKSLFGIHLPQNWIKVWRMILKDPNLRDPSKASRNGNAIGSYTHLWNLWSEECVNKYLNPMEKDLLSMVDSGMLYAEIGYIMLGKYGDEFWKPRKVNTKTTPEQIVNSWMYWKMPNHIARSELTDLALTAIKNFRTNCFD